MGTLRTNLATASPMAKRSKPRRSKSSSWPARSCANNLAVNGWDVVWFFKKRKETHCKNIKEVSNNIKQLSRQETPNNVGEWDDNI